MTLYLGVAILLFFLLFFIPREGFDIEEKKSKGIYSDNNVVGTVDSLTDLNKKLELLKKTVDGFVNPDFSAMEALNSITQVLLTKESSVYTAGVVTTVQNIKDDLDIYQEDVLEMNEYLMNLTKSKKIFQYNENEKKRVALTLPETIDTLQQRAIQLSERLNKIPIR